jgi:hypothetical protein
MVVYEYTSAMPNGCDTILSMGLVQEIITVVRALSFDLINARLRMGQEDGSMLD